VEKRAQEKEHRRSHPGMADGPSALFEFHPLDDKVDMMQVAFGQVPIGGMEPTIGGGT
jgi:hypothetical protein